MFQPYRGDRWLDYEEIVAWCRAAAAACPGFVTCTDVGTSRMGRPLVLVTIGPTEDTPGFWLDGGTHAGEWLGVMSVVYTVSGWVEALVAGDPATVACFSRRTAFAMPCISPDGFQALRDGRPFLRSTVRPPRDGRPRVGLDPGDIDGDGRTRWMRWRSKGGPWVFDDPTSAKLRPRQIEDDPSEAWHVATEGTFVNWDGHRWTTAALQHGLDLNRNFPGSWAPFEMFGMDGGDFALSEPESRAVVEAFRARPRIAAAVTNHTYTGAILTQPYRADTPLGEDDILVMEALARQSVAGTGWRCLRTHPDFTYDARKPIVGVWADTMATMFGVPGYTLELWDPFAFAGVDNSKPGEFWTRPDPAACARIVDAFTGEGGVAPWRRVVHPQLGEVETGGLDLLATLHNPTLRLLPDECAKGATVANRILRSLPDVAVHVDTVALEAGLWVVTARFENVGFLPTSGLRHAERIGLAPPLVAELVDGDAVDGQARREVGWLDGWGNLSAESSRHPLYPGLPFGRSPRAQVKWVVRGEGPFQVRWDAGRGGAGKA